ncbi:LysR family transcriptional regulator [Oscillatoria salina]|uniref:LysR family transcriptional regulator n=1 Tax=Oscillatoria salina TaxID=331517 RepID=UPI0013B72DEA|nr:LysR family transcriptional regulator [Oscillatoria salina]MBZ8179374.1 LysR family transcriptional regulator [Oscillatoria salina IIICB1]NET87536.1 LysR family transcriptional regulator [Kamptonema sp. SIO1D9]
MRIEQLQAFLAIAETGNFGQAAQKCGVTQSTISRQIQSLESDLGLQLFHRTSQAKLTLGGETLFPRARKICLEWQNAIAEIQDLVAGKQPELCVAAIHSVCAYYLPPVLQQFCGDYAEVQLRVTALGSDRALKVLRDGLVDVAIVMNNRFLTASQEMVIEVLFNEAIEVLMSANHPLAEYQEIPWEKLVEYPQVVFKDGYGMQRLVQEWFARQGVTLKAVMELNTLDAFRGVVRQGKAIALLPQSALIEAGQDSTLAVRPIVTNNSKSGHSSTNFEPNFSREVALVTTRDRLDIPPIKHFCDLVRDMMIPQANFLSNLSLSSLTALVG